MGTVFQDVCYGFRTLRKSPGFTAVAILSLALGVGANTAIFSFINAALLKPLEVAEPDRLVSLYQTNAGGGGFLTYSYPEFEFYRMHNHSFSGMLAYLRVPMTVRADGAPRTVSGELFSPDYFRTLGLEAVAGRLPGPEEAAATGAVISEEFWKSDFGGDPDAIGRALRVGEGTFTVIGIAPRSFRGVVLDWGKPPAVWVPIQAYRAAVPAFRDYEAVGAWRSRMYPVTARLRPGVTLAQARAEIESVAARLRDERFRDEDLTTILRPMQQARFWPSHRGSILTIFGVLLAATGLVLLIACFNLANMLLARAAGRTREIAVRLALGAGRMRVARQLLTESLLVAVLGGAVGLLVAVWVAQFLAGFEKPFGIPLTVDTSPDARVLAFTFAVLLAAGVLSGLAPALQASRRDLSSAIQQGAAGIPHAHFGLRNTLVVAQVALSVLLVCGAGLFVRTLQKARAEQTTLNPSGVALLKLDLASAHYDGAKAALFYPRVLAEAKSLPGVSNAALVWIMPWSGGGGGGSVRIGNRTVSSVNFNLVSPGYFETASVPVVRGRSLTGRDGARTAIVNEAFARTYWPGEDPIGKTFTTHDELVHEVAGVVRDGKYAGYRDHVRPCYYLPLGAAQTELMVTLMIRSEGSPVPLVAAAQARVRAIDRDILIADARTLAAHIDTALSKERFLAALASGLGVLALALAALGIYGVVSFAVAQRTREIGIRVALGATAGDVRRMVLRQVLGVTAMGIVAGLAAALAAGRLIEKLLYGVTATDTATYTAVIVLFTAIAAAAGYFPARRAARTDPLTALRWE
jgi:predicted permease